LGRRTKRRAYPQEAAITKAFRSVNCVIFPVVIPGIFIHKPQISGPERRDPIGIRRTFSTIIVIIIFLSHADSKHVFSGHQPTGSLSGKYSTIPCGSIERIGGFQIGHYYIFFAKEHVAGFLS
jgi:hypothetical protein